MEISKRKSSNKDELKKMAKKKLMERKQKNHKKDSIKESIKAKLRRKLMERKSNKRKTIKEEYYHSGFAPDDIAQSIFDDLEDRGVDLKEVDIEQEVTDILDDYCFYGNDDDKDEMIKYYAESEYEDLAQTAFDYAFPEVVRELETLIDEALGENKEDEDIKECNDTKKKLKESVKRKLRKRIAEDRKRYELTPVRDSRKSFYGKAHVEVEDDGTETLYSYNTKIMSKKPDGKMVRYWDDWSMTTGRHIAEFSGLNKKGYFDLELVNESLSEKCDDFKKAKDSLKKECGDAKSKLRESVRRKLRSKLNEKKNTTDEKLDEEIENLMEQNLFRFSKLYK